MKESDRLKEIHHLLSESRFHSFCDSIYSIDLIISPFRISEFFVIVEAKNALILLKFPIQLEICELFL